MGPSHALAALALAMLCQRPVASRLPNALQARGFPLPAFIPRGGSLAGSDVALSRRERSSDGAVGASGLSAATEAVFDGMLGDASLTESEVSSSSSDSSSGSSQFNGVSFHKASGKWQANLRVGGKQRHLGIFADPVDAALAHDEALRALGLTAKTLNKINLPTQDDIQQVFPNEDDEVHLQEVRFDSLADSSTYFGVDFDDHSGRWTARAYVDGVLEYLGSYDSEREAAEAHDDALRAGGLDFTSLRSINFLNADDVYFASLDSDVEPIEPPKASIQEKAKDIIKALLEETSVALRWLPKGSQADGVVRASDSAHAEDQWLGLKLKSTSSPGPKKYTFGKTDGDDALVYLCVELYDMTVWVIPAKDMEVKYLTVTRGGKWDAYQVDVSNLSRALLKLWSESDTPARKSLSEWKKAAS